MVCNLLIVDSKKFYSDRLSGRDFTLSLFKGGPGRKAAEKDWALERVRARLFNHWPSAVRRG
jgi:hypothetical protein